MKDKEMKASEIALYIERLSQPEFHGEVERAVGGKDESLLMRVCQKAGIPAIYTVVLISIFLNRPNPFFRPMIQGWPPGF